MRHFSLHTKLSYTHIDLLVDNTVRHRPLSFMDGYERYNQIKMAEEDPEKIIFIMQLGTFYYNGMSFVLLNAKATYKTIAQILLDDMMHKELQVYVDEMTIKSKTMEGHAITLWKFFKS